MLLVGWFFYPFSLPVFCHALLFKDSFLLQEKKRGLKIKVLIQNRPGFFSCLLSSALMILRAGLCIGAHLGLAVSLCPG